jgi:ABC-2 type transport system permease protein
MTTRQRHEKDNDDPTAEKFVMLAQKILCRGADLGVVWPRFIGLALIGASLLALSLACFRQTLATMA